MAEDGSLDEGQGARADWLRGQIALASGLGRRSLGLWVCLPEAAPASPEHHCRASHVESAA